jgi:hypothetical protein
VGRFDLLWFDNLANAVFSRLNSNFVNAISLEVFRELSDNFIDALSSNVVLSLSSERIGIIAQNYIELGRDPFSATEVSQFNNVQLEALFANAVFSPLGAVQYLDLSRMTENLSNAQVSYIRSNPDKFPLYILLNTHVRSDVADSLYNPRNDIRNNINLYTSRKEDLTAWISTNGPEYNKTGMDTAIQNIAQILNNLYGNDFQLIDAATLNDLLSLECSEERTVNPLDWDSEITIDDEETYLGHLQEQNSQDGGDPPDPHPTNDAPK